MILKFSKHQVDLKVFPQLSEMTNPNSPHFPPPQDHIPQQTRIGIEVPLDFHTLKPELKSSPIAVDEINDNFISLSYRVDVEVLNNWNEESPFMKGGIGYVVEEPDISDDIRSFCKLFTGATWRSGYCLIS